MPIREQLPDATLIHRAFRGIAAISILVVSLAAPCGASADTLPTRFDRHSGVYDSARARSVIFGGFDGLSRSNQTWSLTLADTPHWDSLASVNPAPPGRAGHCAIYDPVRDQLVVFGGSPEGGAGLNETWTRSLASPETWTQLSPAGQLPSPRLYSSAIYDPLRDRMLIFGGGLSGYFNDVWALSLGGTPRWDSLAVAPGSIPSPRQGHAAIYDPLRDRMIVFGGLFASTVTWQFSFSNAAWTPISTLGAPPSARSGHSATYDPVGDRLLVFGGLDGNGQRLNEVYELSLGGVPTWSRLAPTGSLPSPRFYHSADYDLSRHAIVVFGGDHSGTDETWALSLLPAPAWSPWAPVLAVSGGE